MLTPDIHHLVGFWRRDTRSCLFQILALQVSMHISLVAWPLLSNPEGPMDHPQTVVGPEAVTYEIRPWSFNQNRRTVAWTVDIQGPSPTPLSPIRTRNVYHYADGDFICQWLEPMNDRSSHESHCSDPVTIPLSRGQLSLGKYPPIQMSLAVVRALSKSHVKLKNHCVDGMLGLAAYCTK